MAVFATREKLRTSSPGGGGLAGEWVGEEMSEGTYVRQQ